MGEGITKEAARDIIGGDHDGYKVVDRAIDDVTRWSVSEHVIVKCLATGKYYCLEYSYGATEMQDEQPFEYDEPVFIEVKPIEKTITVYEGVKDATS